MDLYSYELNLTSIILIIVMIFLSLALIFFYIKYHKINLNKDNQLDSLEDKYIKMLSYEKDAIWALDKNAYTNFVNKNLANLLLYEPDEMIGKHLFDFMTKESIKIAKEKLEDRKKGVKEEHYFEFIKKMDLFYILL